MSKVALFGKECRESLRIFGKRSPFLVRFAFCAAASLFLGVGYVMYRLGPIADDRSFDYLRFFLILLGEYSLGNF